MLILFSLVASSFLALLLGVPGSPMAQATAVDPALQQALQALVGVAGAPVAAQLVSALVKPFVSDVRFYGPAALLIGVLWNLLITLGLSEMGLHQFWVAAVIMGVLSGLAASGMVSSTRAEVNQDLAARGVAIIPNPPPKQ